MSTFKHPVGPKSPAVYWRRRLVLFLALVAVVVAIVLIVVRLGSLGGEPAAPKAKTGPAATATAGATSIPTPSASAGGRGCNPAEVKVDAVTDQSSYAAGQLPQLSIAITNTGGSPCTVDAGTAQQVFTITSESEVYWKSTDCQTEKVNADVLLQPGETISSQAPITWDRTRSDPATCQAQRAQVPAGGSSYHLETSVAGIVAQTSKQFVLQ
ncbi:hypothetical protein ATY41_11245 [Leifsonia xyli subsp. xyli]|nr:hypothetical protein [Leifsonia xyli]ODA90170.1 hypothetical protein ATY41_11245 [Leifsonia xyli subsp. xyli]